MDGLSNYLLKFTKLLSTHVNLKKITIESILEIVRIDVPENSITIKDSIITIKANPIVKTELFIRKDKLIKLINTKAGKVVISEIR